MSRREKLPIPEDVMVTFDPALRIHSPRVEAVLLCDYINMTGDGKYNVMGIYERVWIVNKEVPFHRFIIYAKVAEITDGKLVIRIVHSDGELLYAAEVGRENPPVDGKDRWLVTHSVVDLALERPGTHWIDFEYNGEPIGGASFAVDYFNAEDMKLPAKDERSDN
jgi:hypothetical protein